MVGRVLFLVPRPPRGEFRVLSPRGRDDCYFIFLIQPKVSAILPV